MPLLDPVVKEVLIESVGTSLLAAGLFALAIGLSFNLAQMSTGAAKDKNRKA